jgi:hypothetical protein
MQINGPWLLDTEVQTEDSPCKQCAQMKALKNVNCQAELDRETQKLKFLKEIYVLKQKLKLADESSKRNSLEIESLTARLRFKDEQSVSLESKYKTLSDSFSKVTG